MTKPGIHIICGATASGKSALALKLAEAHNGVIINADSQQLYADLRILTARPTPKDEARVAHKLYGILSGEERADVAKWLKFARMEIDWARTNGQTPYVVGGSGMYIHALMHGIADIPDVPDAVKNQAENDLRQMGAEAFHERLAAVDPALAAKIPAGDTQRMMRGYSVWLASGKPITFWQSQEAAHFYAMEDFKITLVEMPREELYARCNERAGQMLQQGAIQEVEALLQQGYSDSLPIMRVIGVPEISAMLSGKISAEECVHQIQQATRNYAKRQMTWFRNKL